MQAKQPTEHQEQKTFFAWCLRKRDVYKGINSIFSIPNSGNFDAIRGKLLKNEGLRAGVPDMFLPVACNNYHGLFIEMKIRKGGKVSPKQKEWMNVLSRQGYKTAVCEGFGEARKTVMGYYDEQC